MWKSPCTELNVLPWITIFEEWDISGNVWQVRWLARKMEGTLIVLSLTSIDQGKYSMAQHCITLLSTSRWYASFEVEELLCEEVHSGGDRTSRLKSPRQNQAPKQNRILILGVCRWQLHWLTLTCQLINLQRIKPEKYSGWIDDPVDKNHCNWKSTRNLKVFSKTPV